MVQPWYGLGARMVQPWCEDGAALVQPWCEDGVSRPEIGFQLLLFAMNSKDR
jgi:hypothetical protein